MLIEESEKKQNQKTKPMVYQQLNTLKAREKK